MPINVQQNDTTVVVQQNIDNTTVQRKTENVNLEAGGSPGPPGPPGPAGGVDYDSLPVATIDPSSDYVPFLDATDGEQKKGLPPSSGGGGGGAWGSITGDIANQTDLQDELALKADSSSLADVATSGDYTDLSNKPTIPTSHTELSDIGTNTHPQIDAHINNSANPHGVTATQVGLGNVDNTSDANKPISTATQTALDGKANSVHTHTAANITDFNTAVDARISTASGSANGIAPLDGDSKIPTSYLPAIAVSETFVVNSEAAQLALMAQEGDIAVRTDISKTFIQNGGSSGTMADWTEFLTPSDLVISVNGYTGAVTLVKSDVGLGNVDNTSDANKPVSTAQQTALDLKANSSALTSHVSDTGNPHVVTATQVGLGDVDNTSDANKPVSTAQQAALDDKADSSALTAHINDNANPHSVTAGQVGLGNVDNTSDADKPVSTATQTALDGKLDTNTNKVIGEFTFGDTSGAVGTGDIDTVTWAVTDATIIGWRVSCDVSSTLSITVKVNGSSIVASAPITITTGTSNSSETLTGWTTELSAGDVVSLELTANDNAQRVDVQLYGRVG